MAEENYFYDLKISEIYDKLDAANQKEIDDDCLAEYNKKYSDLSAEEKNKLDQCIEEYLSVDIENPLSILINRVKENTSDFNKWVATNCLFISEQDKHEMAYYLAKQFVRGKSYRDFLTASYENMYKGMIPIFAQFKGLNINSEEIEVSVSKEFSKYNHIKALIDDKTSNLYASVFFSHKWKLYENKTSIPFLTCDDPFILIPTKKHQ